MTTFFTLLGEKRQVVYKKKFPELWPKQSVIVKKVAEEWKLEKQEKKLKVAKSELKTMLELYGMPKRPL